MNEQIEFGLDYHGEPNFKGLESRDLGHNFGGDNKGGEKLSRYEQFVLFDACAPLVKNSPILENPKGESDRTIIPPLTKGAWGQGNSHKRTRNTRTHFNLEEFGKAYTSITRFYGGINPTLYKDPHLKRECLRAGGYSHSRGRGRVNIPLEETEDSVIGRMYRLAEEKYRKWLSLKSSLGNLSRAS